MSDQQIDHGAVAAITVIGAFAVIIASQVTHEQLSATLATLVVGSVGTVLGFFFGSRGSQAGQEATHAALTTVSGLLQQQNPPPDATAPLPVEPDGPAATPKE
jgi:hypothetical protein